MKHHGSNQSHFAVSRKRVPSRRGINCRATGRKKRPCRVRVLSNDNTRFRRFMDTRVRGPRTGRTTSSRLKKTRARARFDESGTRKTGKCEGFDSPCREKWFTSTDLSSRAGRNSITVSRPLPPPLHLSLSLSLSLSSSVDLNFCRKTGRTYF